MAPIATVAARRQGRKAGESSLVFSQSLQRLMVWLMGVEQEEGVADPEERGEGGGQQLAGGGAAPALLHLHTGM